MNIYDKVVSQKLSKKLVEAGIIIDWSTYYWRKSSYGKWILFTEPLGTEYPAPLLVELVDYWQTHFNINKSNLQTLLLTYQSKGWYVNDSVWKDHKKPYESQVKKDNLPTAMAKFILWVKKMQESGSSYE